MNEVERIATLLASLASPTRLRIVRELGKQPRYVNELAGVLNIPQSTLSNHLRLLRERGIVDFVEQRVITTGGHYPDRLHLYALVPGAVEEVAKELTACAESRKSIA